jgi:hypothetical protein
MGRNCRFVRRAAVLGACVAAVALLSLPSRGAPPPTYVQLKVTAVRASQQGDESIDPKLGDLGSKLQKKYNAKRLEVIDEVVFTAGDGLTLVGPLGDEMRFKIAWGGANSRGVADFTIGVTRAKQTIIPNSHLKIKLNDMALLDGRLDRDALILVMTAQNGDE